MITQIGKAIVCNYRCDSPLFSAFFPITLVWDREEKGKETLPVGNASWCIFKIYRERQ